MTPGDDILAAVLVAGYLSCSLMLALQAPDVVARMWAAVVRGVR